MTLNSLHSSSKSIRFSFFFILALWTLSGCKTVPKAGTQPYKTENYQRSSPVLFVEDIRIAVLPIALEGYNAHTDSWMNDIFIQEMITTHHFEVIKIDEKLLQNEFKDSQFRVHEELPDELFSFIEDETRAQAVMFVEITSYHPYQPIRIGLKCTLIDLNTIQVLWKADDIFFVGKNSIEKGAYKYSEDVTWRPDNSATSRNDVIYQSPRLFLGYASRSILKTLPKRKANEN